MLELAIFGMVALAALGFLIRVGMQMNYDQEIRMAAFRRALAAAAADNGTNQDALAVTYYYASDRQMPNPTEGLMTLPRTRTEASAFVEWGQRLTFAHQDDDGENNEDTGRATSQKIIVRSNGAEQTFRQNDFVQANCVAEPLCNVVTDAYLGLTTKAVSTSTSSGTAMQSTTGSSVSMNTGTDSTIWVNTKDGPTPVTSSIGGGGSWPPR